jgi:hypothetical protein
MLSLRIQLIHYLEVLMVYGIAVDKRSFFVRFEVLYIYSISGWSQLDFVRSSKLKSFLHRRQRNPYWIGRGTLSLAQRHKSGPVTWRSAVYPKIFRKRTDNKCWFYQDSVKMTRSHILLHCRNTKLVAARMEAWERKDPGASGCC